MHFIELLEQALGRQAIKDFQPIQPGDVTSTAADTKALSDWVGFRPCTDIKTGLQCFADWYKNIFKNGF